MTEAWRQATFARNYRVLLAHGVSRAEAGRLAKMATDTRHRYVTVYGGELWCDTHDSAYPCAVRTH